MSAPCVDLGSFKPGVRVHQTGLVGLAYLNFNPFVVEVVNDKLHLSQTPGGPMLTDLHGNPMDYPYIKFMPIVGLNN